MNLAAMENPAMRAGMITSQTAREKALKMHEKRRAKLARLEQDAKDAAAMRQKLQEMNPQSGRLAGILQTWEREIELEQDIDSRVKLANAYDKLFKAWQVLTGTPNPGARRTGKRERAPAIQPEPEPVQAVTSPVTQAPDSGPKA